MTIGTQLPSTHMYVVIRCALGLNQLDIGSGKGTHLSVFIHLMCGEYDEFLQWPFHGEVTFQLLNQRKDGWHVQKSMQMIDSKACIRVVNRRANVLGFGFECFMVNTKLGYNRITGTEYLKNDTLKFRVLSVVLP